MMAKGVKVIVSQSFEGCHAGDEAWLVLTPRVEGLIAAGVLQVIGHSEPDPEPEPAVVWPPPAVPDPEPDGDDG